MNVKERFDNRIEDLRGGLESFSQDLRKGSRQVWLAGLGAVSLVDEQGRAFFEGARLGELAQKGEERRKQIEGSAREAFEKVETRVKQAGAEAGERLGRTLERLGVPSSSQIQLLIERVEQLNAKVEKLAAQG